MDKLLGFLSPVFIAALVFILNALIPGRWITRVYYLTRFFRENEISYQWNLCINCDDTDMVHAGVFQNGSL